MKKVADNGDGSRLLEVLENYLDRLKQFVKGDDDSFKTLDITSDVLQSSLLGPLLYCIFVNDLAEFGDSFFTDAFKLVAHENLETDTIWPQTSWTMGERKEDAVCPEKLFSISQ